jgi:hypothetical protein
LKEGISLAHPNNKEPVLRPLTGISDFMFVSI